MIPKILVVIASLLILGVCGPVIILVWLHYIAWLAAWMGIQ